MCHRFGRIPFNKTIKSDNILGIIASSLMVRSLPVPILIWVFLISTFESRDVILSENLSLTRSLKSTLSITNTQASAISSECRNSLLGAPEPHNFTVTGVSAETCLKIPYFQAFHNLNLRRPAIDASTGHLLKSFRMASQLFSIRHLPDAFFV